MYHSAHTQFWLLSLFAKVSIYNTLQHLTARAVILRCGVRCRYMDRLALPSSELHLYVTPLTAHRLFAASLIIAIKFIAENPPSIFDDRQATILADERNERPSFAE